MSATPEKRVAVVARFSVQADRVDEFARAAQRDLVDPTQGEPGCIRYALWQDVEDPTCFAMLEEWESEEALATHLSQPSLGEAVGRLQPLAAGPIEVKRYRPVRGG